MTICFTLLFVSVMALGLLIAFGCDSVATDIADPNSGLNQTVEAIETIAPAITTAATTTGTSVGLVIGGIATAISALIGVYNNYKKNIVIDEKDAHLKNTTTTTKAIVSAVEKLSSVEVGAEGKTVGEIVKSEVKINLKDSDAYKIGKAIINGLK